MPLSSSSSSPAPAAGQTPIQTSAAEVTHPADLEDRSEPASPEFKSAFVVFGSTFVTVFLAELGDKTQVTTLLISAESHSPMVVFAGAACALVLTSLVGVLLGQWLSHRVSPQLLHKTAGFCLVAIALGLLWDTIGQ